MRTDIPAFYSPWLLNRLREGYVMVRNPYNPQSVSRYELRPDIVDLITFCTKNPIPVLRNPELLSKLAPYPQWWFVTLTPYGKDIEPHVPEKVAVADAIIELGTRLGSDCVGWRYDPIFLSEKYTIPYHLKAFENIAKRIQGATKTAVISFIDLYPKVRRNFPEAREVTVEEQLILGKEMAAIAANYGMTLRPCAEGDLLSQFGADCSGCQTVAVLEKACGKQLKVPVKKQGRKDCFCFMNGDIGAYSSCGHLCRYCYANTDPDTVRRTMQAHDPSSPLLIGHLSPDDVVSTTVQKSWAIEVSGSLF